MRDFLLEHARKNCVSFHMPGHKGSEIFRKYGYGDFLDDFVDCDVTEIPGADNLFQAEGIIRETQNKYRDLYEVKNSYLLINGTSSGLIASILATVKPGGSIIMARNCHKSVFNALTLGSIKPVYAQPELIEAYGIAGAISPEEIKRCIEQKPEASAVILPSPNYYGICSDIEAIAEVAHEAGKVLIVDQAHGAHLKFFSKFGYEVGMPKAAEDCGADLVVNSIHKTLASLTQSAVLNLNSDRVDRYVLEDKLQAIQSTSPSYILMSFLDINADLLREHGEETIGAWRANIEYFYENAATIKDLRILMPRNGGAASGGASSNAVPSGNASQQMDITKINLDMSALGIDGARLEELLMEYGIYSELHTGNILMLMTGIGNTREDMDRTLGALDEIARKHTLAKHSFERENLGHKAHVNSGNKVADDKGLGDDRISDNGRTEGDLKIMGGASIPAPGQMHEVPENKEFVSLAEADGRVAASSIIPYPPGIPFVCPGEEITADTVRYITDLRNRGEKVIGVNDKGEVLVGCTDK